MGTKVIRFSLDPHSIDEAIHEVRQYRDDLKKAVQGLVRALTEEGREAAVMNVLRLGAFDTGELADTSFHTRGYFSEDEAIGIIYTDSYYAVFVEYGTGVVGKEGPRHPMLPAGWVHDHNNHGEKGWWYLDEGKWHWTKGQEARPFMYQTYLELIRMAREKLRDLNL